MRSSICAQLTHVAIVKPPQDALLRFFSWGKSICVIHVVIEELPPQQRGCLSSKRWASFSLYEDLFGSA